MTPLEFFISVKNSQAMNGLQEVQAKVNSFKDSTDELYEGPAREMRMRTEIRGLIKDISLGKDPVFSLISAFERLSEMARWAGPLAAILAIITGITMQESAAYKGALEFLDAYRSAMSGDVKNMTIEQLKATGKAIDEAEEKLKNASWLQKLISRGVDNKAMANLIERRDEVDKSADAEEAAQAHAQTVRMKYEESGRRDIEDEIAQVRLDYQAKQDAAMRDGHYAAASAYQEQMEAAVDVINERVKKEDEEAAERKASHLQELNDQLAKAQEESQEVSLQAMQARYNQLGQWIESMADPAEKVKLQIEQTELGTKIRDKTSADALRDQDRAQRDQDKATAAAEKIARLRKDVADAQFENLSKEDKIVVLRQEQLDLQKELASRDPNSAEGLALQKELAVTAKQLKDLAGGDSILKGVDAMSALGSTAAYGFRGAVTNDAANRAERQRDQMVTLLTKIAQQKALGGLEGF